MSEVIELAQGEPARRDEARYSMLERLADHDDALMEQLLEDIQPPRDKIFSDLAAELRAGQIVPVLIGSALNGNGIMRLLKALRHEAPNVEDTRRRLGIADAGKTLLQVMKTIHTSHAGKLSVVRVLAGKLDDGMELQTAGGELGKVSGLFRMVGQKTTKRGTAEAGETVGLGKVEHARTGDTLGAKGGKAAQIETPAAPQAVLRQVVNPSERKDEVKLSSALARMVEEDPSLSVDHRQDTGETAARRPGRDAPPRRGGAAHEPVPAEARDEAGARPLSRDDPRHRLQARPAQEAERRARAVR